MENLYHVQIKQWAKWHPHAQHVFNHTYGVMLENQRLFLHPHAPLYEPQHWATTCWNAAWTAAEAVMGR